MNTLYISTATVSSNRNITLTFSQDIANPGLENFTVFAKKESVTQPQILSIFLSSSNTVEITVTPLHPLTEYTVTAQSTTRKFISKDNTAILNKQSVTVFGIIETNNNIVKSNIKRQWGDNIYDLENPDGVIGKYVNITSAEIASTLYSVRQVKNESFLSRTIIDEYKTRGAGASDRLNEESAFEIIRVSTNPTDKKLSYILYKTELDSRLVSLQERRKQETVSQPASILLTLSKPIIIAWSITVTTTIAIDYNIDKYSYFIKNNGFDPASRLYQDISDYQIRLNDTFFEDNLIKIEDMVSIAINYSYKDLTIFVYPGSESVYYTKTSIREELPAISNIIDLQFNNICDGSGNPQTLGLLQVKNSNSTNLTHPAFLLSLIHI